MMLHFHRGWLSIAGPVRCVCVSGLGSGHIERRFSVWLLHDKDGTPQNDINMNMHTVSFHQHQKYTKVLFAIGAGIVTYIHELDDDFTWATQPCVGCLGIVGRVVSLTVGREESMLGCVVQTKGSPDQ